MNKRILIFALLATAVGLGVTACSKGGEGSKPASTAGENKQPVKVAGDSDIIPVGNAYTKGGGADALVTLVEFSEFQCPFCSRVNPTLKQITDKYGDKVRIAFKHNPLSFHKDAPLAAKYALAAGNQGKFWEMHDKLFENQKALKESDLEGYAKGLGLNLEQIKKDLDGLQKVIDEDMALADKVGARGTPNFLINGKQLAGAQPLERFTAVIDEEIKAAEELIAKGTPKDQIYAARVKANFKAPEAPKPAAEPATDKTVYKIPVSPSAYKKGGKEPLVTIIEFSEFECPFCSRVMPTLQKIHDTYKDDVQVVFMHNPLPFHKNAVPASEASLAAGAQGKFWEMHDKLFANQRALTRPDLEKYAEEIGLDMSQFKADLDSGKFKAQIEGDQKIAAQFGARGTPNFFVNGRQITGARPYEAFQAVIDEELKKAKDLIEKGTPRANIYAKVTENGQTKAAAPAARPDERAPDTTVYKVPVNPEDVVKGKADALVTIIEFSEFQCPFCSRVNPTIAGLQNKYGDDIRIVFKHNPLPFHKEAPLASEASLAANEQGKFWEMHDKLFANQRALQRDQIEGYAQEIGLDMTRFKAALDSGKFKKQIEADMALAREIGAGGTPNFFINGRKLVGAQPQASFETLIDEQLKKAKDLVAKGTPRSEVYAALIKDGATKPAAAPGPRPAEDDKTVYEVKVNPEDAWKGGKNAAVTIVEFSEFQCPFCSRVNPTIQGLMDKYGDKIKIVFKHNPLAFHKEAPLASEAALAAGAQGKFWEMHDLLFKNQRALQRDDLERYAVEIGLNMNKFKQDLDSGKFKAQIEADMAEARKHGASGTPTFFINGRKLRGAQPQPSFERLIDEALSKK